MVEQHRQFPGYCHQGSLLCILAAAFSQLHPPSSQITVWPEGSQNIVSRMDEQLPQVGVSTLGNPQLGILVSRLVPFGNQPQCRSHITALAEAVWDFQGEHKYQGGQGNYSVNLLKMASFRIALFTELFDLPVIFPYLPCYRVNDLQDR